MQTAIEETGLIKNKNNEVYIKKKKRSPETKNKNKERI